MYHFNSIFNPNMHNSFTHWTARMAQIIIIMVILKLNTLSHYPYRGNQRSG